MHTLYDSDSFQVVLIDVAASAEADVPASTHGPLSHGGFEVVDKFAGKGIFLQGAMAESFKDGVAALIRTQPSEEEVDEYLGRFSSLMQQPVVRH
jgi:hypothetical protein